MAFVMTGARAEGGRRVRFGIFDHLERRSDVPLARQYEDRLRLMELADAAGVTGYHVAEHHHSPLCLAPNQAVYLAAVAQRTKALRMGPLVYVLPLHQPIRLVEEIAMVDQISDGRYQVGVGPGTGGGTEYAMWGGEASENAERFEETLQILRRGLQTDFLAYHGRHFDYDDLWMELRPVQQPHPPLWWAGRAETAARRGANYVGTGSIRGLTESMATYRATLDEVSRDHDPEMVLPAEPLYGGMKHLFIADTDAEAIERATSAYQAYRGHFAKPARAGTEATAGAAGAFNEAVRQSELLNPRSAQPAVQTAGQPERARGGPASFEPERALELEVLLAGSPATIRGYAERYRAVGANYFVGAFQWGDLTHDEAAHSLELFASEVMPAFE